MEGPWPQSQSDFLSLPSQRSSEVLARCSPEALKEDISTVVWNNIQNVSRSAEFSKVNCKQGYDTTNATYIQCMGRQHSHGRKASTEEPFHTCDQLHVLQTGSYDRLLLWASFPRWLSPHNLAETQNYCYSLELWQQNTAVHIMFFVNCNRLPLLMVG